MTIECGAGFEKWEVSLTQKGERRKSERLEQHQIGVAWLQERAERGVGLLQNITMSRVWSREAQVLEDVFEDAQL